MKITFNCFYREYKHFNKSIHKALDRVFKSGRYILGNECKEFERDLATIINAPYCAAVANGTEAITLALRAHGIKPGDEVITTSLTAYPTIVGIVEAGGTPVIVDIDYKTGLIDVSKIEDAVTSNTKAIMPVHIYGQACDMTTIIKIANRQKLIIIEDCAQSIGAKWKDKSVGSFGDNSTFSFYPTKNLGAYGDGGAIVSKHKHIYEKLVKLRNYGQSVRYHHEELGINSRLDEIQAAILRAKLPDLKKRIERRRQIAKYYDKNLKTVDHVIEQKDSFHTYHLYIVKSNKRQKLMQHLKSKGIETLIHYPIPVYKQAAFHYKKNYNLPVVEKFSKEILSIPIYPELTDTEVEYIVKAINSFD